MIRQSQEVQEIYNHAQEYDRIRDHYNAVKLFKKLIRLVPDWYKPYQHLGAIYKVRKEWKPSFHYIQKAIDANPQDEISWWNLGIVATAMKRWRLARIAWNETGYKFNDQKDTAIDVNLGIAPVRINPESRSEIIWTERIDPARAIIESIPHPASGKRYRDVLLIDGIEQGYSVVNQRKMPVYDELIVLSQSRYRTFVVELVDVEPNDITILDKLCLNADLGFDNWSKATRSLVTKRSNVLPEYYTDYIPEDWNGSSYIVAIAAHQEEEVLEVLKSWEVITLKNYHEIECVL